MYESITGQNRIFICLLYNVLVTLKPFQALQRQQIKTQQMKLRQQLQQQSSYAYKKQSNVDSEEDEVV